ncbi:MAG: hypothetical protein AAFU61_17425, partial [Pseudomonadota bacterium]
MDDDEESDESSHPAPRTVISLTDVVEDVPDDELTDGGDVDTKRDRMIHHPADWVAGEALPTEL